MRQGTGNSATHQLTLRFSFLKPSLLVTCLMTYIFMKKIILKCNVKWVRMLPSSEVKGWNTRHSTTSAVMMTWVACWGLCRVEQRSPCPVPGQTGAFPSWETLVLAESSWACLCCEIIWSGGKCCLLAAWLVSYYILLQPVFHTMQAVGSTLCSGTIFKSLPNIKTLASRQQTEQWLDRWDLEAWCLLAQS